MSKVSLVAMIVTFVVVVMSMTGCGRDDDSQRARSSDATFVETYWKLVRVEGVEVVPVNRQREAHLLFKTEGERLSGSGGCNRIMGKYALDEGHIAFSQIAETMMACPNLDDERKFLTALRSVDSYAIDGEQMRMTRSGEVLLEFKAIALH